MMSGFVVSMKVGLKVNGGLELGIDSKTETTSLYLSLVSMCLLYARGSREAS